MAKEYANEMLDLLHEWAQVSPSTQETKETSFEKTMQNCHSIMTKESSSGVLLWDPVFLPWDGAVQVSGRLGKLLQTVKSEEQKLETVTPEEQKLEPVTSEEQKLETAINFPKLNMLNITGRTLTPQDVPLQFPPDINVEEFLEANPNQKFDVIITNTEATPEDTLLGFMKQKLWPHGDLVCFGELTQRIEQQLLDNKYSFYRNVPDDDTEQTFIIIKQRNVSPVLNEIIKSCLNVVTKCTKYFRKLKNPEANKIAVQWKINMSKLKQGMENWQRTEFAEADTLWRIKFLLWSVYEVVLSLLSFLQNPSKLVFLLIRKICKALLKVFVSLFHLMLYGGLLITGYSVATLATVTVFSFTGIVGFFLTGYISSFRKLAMTMISKTLSKNYFVFVRNLLKQYKENQIYFWILVGAVLPVTFVSYIGSEFMTGLVVDLAQAFRVMFVEVVNQAHALVKNNINLKYWVLEALPLTWLQQFFTTYIFTPFQRYILTPILDSAYYQSLAGTCAFILWMERQYDDIYIGPNRLYVPLRRNSFYYIDYTMNQITSKKQDVGSTQFLYMNNYFETEPLCSRVIKNLQKQKQHWTYFTSNKLKFLKGKPSYVFLDAVNTLLQTRERFLSYDDVKREDRSKELEKIQTEQQRYKESLEKFKSSLNNSPDLSEESKKAVLTLLEQEIEVNHRALTGYLYSSTELLTAFETLKHPDAFYADVAALQSNLTHFQNVSNALKTELIIFGKKIWLTGQAVVRGSIMREREIKNPVIETTATVDPHMPPLYFYLNENGTFSPLIHLNVVALSQ